MKVYKCEITGWADVLEPHRFECEDAPRITEMRWTRIDSEQQTRKTFAFWGVLWGGGWGVGVGVCGCVWVGVASC